MPVQLLILLCRLTDAEVRAKAGPTRRQVGCRGDALKNDGERLMQARRRWEVDPARGIGLAQGEMTSARWPGCTSELSKSSSTPTSSYSQ